MLLPGVCKVPFKEIAMLYGTAWKEEKTTSLVKQAITLGFRGIDTACQPKHYQENLVGQALKEMIQAGTVAREEVWLQTKFTSLDGQDPSRVPYDKSADLQTQVRQSVEKSRQNLNLEVIDSLVLHGPVRGSYDSTLTAWRAMEEAVDAGKVRFLGASNVYDLKFFTNLYNDARHKPIVLQNRFYGDTGFDRELREFCSAKQIRYQSFWTLTANPGLLGSPPVQELAGKHAATPAQIVYRYIIDASGGQPLSGCTSVNHVKEAVAVKDMTPLKEEEINTIEKIMYAGSRRKKGRGRGEL